MAAAWLGLGGNIGDVQSAMSQALNLLDSHNELSVTKVSPVYKTPPWGVEDQPWFLNCCVEIETGLSPLDLLAACQEAEREGKRERIIRWGPRTIDIDILFFEGVERDEPRLTIPHPRISQRAFVLLPLADIAPQLLLDGVSVKDRAKTIDRAEIELIVTHWWQ